VVEVAPVVSLELMPHQEVLVEVVVDGPALQELVEVELVAKVILVVIIIPQVEVY
jgi:hypothetical protein